MRTDGISIRAWAKKHKANYWTIYQGIQRGLSIDEACANALKRKGKKDSSAKYFVGKLTLRYYCIQNNINYKHITALIRKGLTIQQALARSKK
jgi:hypothetical protein